MTSPRKIAANRKNARRSTGPRTRRGKLRVRGNAFRHGLATTVSSDPALTDEIERLAKGLAGETRSATRRATAHAAAEAEIELRRVRRHRAMMLRTEIVMEKLETAKAGGNVHDPAIKSQAMVRVFDRLQRLERYIRRATSRRNRLFRELAACPI
jgi:hypothetical protein